MQKVWMCFTATQAGAAAPPGAAGSTMSPVGMRGRMLVGQTAQCNICGEVSAVACMMPAAHNTDDAGCLILTTTLSWFVSYLFGK